jgi:hypothetical protein
MVSILYKWLLLFSVFNLPGNIDPVKKRNNAHPIFMSVTEIEHNAKDKTLEISCKIFTDDLERTLRQTNKGTIDLINPKDKPAMNNAVNNYIQKHFAITVNGKKAVLQFIGYEQKEEAIMSYLQVDNITAVNKIDIIDNILYESKKEQLQIIHVLVDGNRKSTRLNNPEDKCSFEF